METLAARGITRLLVEGGPAVWRAFSQAGLVHEAIVFQAGAIEPVSYPEGQTPIPEGQTPRERLERFLPNSMMSLADTRRIGDDSMQVWRRA
jgi:diaminohydroxyphosphoribosylaminopyrimidine deaminase/5-amino-6-(5-phosphoribosylamino)uracil reductase